jgi:hypothetical protein
MPSQRDGNEEQVRLAVPDPVQGPVSATHGAPGAAMPA